MARHETPDFRDRLEYAGLAAVLAAFRLGPRQRARRAGARLGRFMNRVAPLRRPVALANIEAAFPETTDRERRDMYRRMLENLGVMLAEFARFERKPTEPPSLDMRVDNPQAFARAREAGKGTVLLTAHFGNWESLGAMVHELGYPVTLLGGRQRNPLVEELFARYHGRIGMKAITVGKSLKPILAALNRNDFVGTLADQDGGPRGFFMDFLGRKASVQPGMFRLIARRGTPMATTFCWREGEGWRAVFHEPVWPREVRGDDEVEAEARRLAGIYMARVEEQVRRHPDHYFWVHRRWRTRPPDEAPRAQPTLPAGR